MKLIKHLEDFTTDDVGKIFYYVVNTLFTTCYVIMRCKIIMVNSNYIIANTWYYFCGRLTTHNQAMWIPQSIHHRVDWVYEAIIPDDLVDGFKKIHQRHFRNHIWEELMAAACHPSRLAQID